MFLMVESGTADWVYASLQSAQCAFGKEHGYFYPIAKASVPENWR